MGKKRNKGNGAVSKPTQSFSKLVAEATTHAVNNVINQRIQQLGFQLAQNQSREMAGLVTRLTAIEQICLEELNINEEQLTEKIATIEDNALGLEKVLEVAEGDTVRVTVAAKKADEDTYGEESKVQVSNCGVSPYTLPKEIEDGLVGLTTGQVVELSFGKDDSMKAKISVDRVSRKIVEESNEETQSSEE